MTLAHSAEKLNTLLRKPWTKLSEEFRRQLRVLLPQERSFPAPGITIAFTPDSNGIRWTGGDVPPGFFVPQTPRIGTFYAAVPQTGIWTLEVFGKATVKLKVGNKKLEIIALRQTVRLKDFRLEVEAGIGDILGDQPDPSVLPHLIVANVKVTSLLELRGDIANQTFPFASFLKDTVDGRLAYVLDTTDIAIPGDRTVVFKGKVALFPGRKRIDVTTAGDLCWRDGGDTIRLPLNQKFGFDLPAEIARGRALEWAKGNTVETPAPPSTAVFDPVAIADEREDSVLRHSPLGDQDNPPFLFVVDSRYPVTGFSACMADAPDPIAFFGAGDTAIWTGHLLAAESFRYASATNDAKRKAAREQLSRVLAAIERLLDVPERFGVKRGLLTRAALPERLAKLVQDNGQKDAMAEPPTSPRALNCYHGASFTDNGVTEKWVGKGRDGDPPSRDSHLGVCLGLATTIKLLGEATPDTEDKTLVKRAKKALGEILGYVVGNEWNLPAPVGKLKADPAPGEKPKDFAIKTTWAGLFYQQLTLLSMGKLVDEAKYKPLFDKALASVAPAGWLGVWGECLNPLAKYYKYNLTMGGIGTLLWLESGTGGAMGFGANATTKKQLENVRDLLRATLGHHRNAYFKLLWVLSHGSKSADWNPALDQLSPASVREETRSACERRPKPCCGSGTREPRQMGRPDRTAFRSASPPMAPKPLCVSWLRRAEARARHMG